MKRPDRKTTLNIAIAAFLSVLLVLTLVPSTSGTIDFRTLCLICGERGLADAILNVILFMPLGLLLGARIRSRVVAYVLAIGISTGIEFAQVFIPGRDSSFADIIYNGLGAVLGVGLARAWRMWLLPGERGIRRLGLIATVGAVSVLVGTDYLMRPAFPSMQYDAAWTPRLRHVVHYEGSLLEASVGGTSTPDGMLGESQAVRSKLLAGEPMQAVVITGAPPAGAAPLLTINGFQMEIASLSLERLDLIFRYRMRSDALRLDSPELLYREAMRGVRPGRTVRIEASRPGKAYCLAVDDSRLCGLGFTPADGWSLLLWSARLPAWLPALLGVVWLAGISFPSGFWSASGRHAVAGALVLVVTLAAVPAAGQLQATPFPHYLAAILGVGAGRAVRAGLTGKRR